MCPYYLDGDLDRARRPVGDTRCHRGLSLRGGCGYCAVFKGRREGAGPTDRHEGRPAGTGLSKLNSMLGLEPGEMPRDARRRGRSLNARRQLGRPGPVDVLAARSVVRRWRPRRRRPRSSARRRAVHAPYRGLPRKEVIQPHLPVRLPCYDFTPVTSPTFDGSLPKGLGHRLRVLLTPVV